MQETYWTRHRRGPLFTFHQSFNFSANSSGIHIFARDPEISRDEYTSLLSAPDEVLTRLQVFAQYLESGKSKHVEQIANYASQPSWVHISVQILHPCWMGRK